MTDHTTNGFGSARTRRPTIEYRFYFAVIFLAYLPISLVTCLLGLARPGSDDACRTFIGRAWHRASVITPMIFTA